MRCSPINDELNLDCDYGALINVIWGIKLIEEDNNANELGYAHKALEVDEDLEETNQTKEAEGHPKHSYQARPKP